MQFPKPLYTVDFKEVRRSHVYPVTMPDGTVIGPLPSVTKIQSIINKPLLVPWAKKMALGRAREELVKALQAGQVIDYAAIDSILELAKKEPDKLKDKAADIGTRTHEAIDKWIMGEAPVLTPDIKPGFDNFMQWLESEKMRVVKGDTNLASVIYGYGGRSDVYFEKDGKLILGDFKTGKALYDDTVVQVGGYDIATEETYGIKVDRAIVLRIGKEIPGDIEPKEVNLAAGRESFLAALALYKRMNKKDTLWIEAIK